MNKLDEIDAQIDKEGITLSTVTAKRLIRAVRQLGEAYGNLTRDMEHPWIDRFYHVDSDVLQLIEEVL